MEMSSEEHIKGGKTLTTKVLLHELSHFKEMSDVAFSEASHAFIEEKRDKSYNAPQPLNGKSSENHWKGEFASDYSSRNYGDEIDDPTEMISTFWDLTMSKDAESNIKNYPDQIYFALGILLSE